MDDRLNKMGGLTLSRRVGDKIVITVPGARGDGDRLIVLTVTKVKGPAVSITAVAPETIGIDREEVWSRNQAQRRGGANASVTKSS